MIPRNINRGHILKAIGEIDRKGIPRGRESRKFQLFHKGKYYPPKYVISLANKYANGVALDSSQFSGGQETNRFLRRLGFEIVEFSPLRVFAKPIFARRKSAERKKSRHNERCSECKRTIEAMLRKIYGIAEVNYRFETGTKPEDYEDTSFYPKLKEIFSELQGYRGHKNFVKSKTLPHCDFFIPNPGFIVEFDESQHFTYPRKITLEHYPEELELGFDRERWMELCERINARDNDPPYRDEQRAWYDTLRDFLPTIKGLKPAIRLFARDFVWCSLDPDNPTDVEKFKRFIKAKSKNWKIEVREDPNPFLARIIIAGKWEGNPKDARKLLIDICKIWPTDMKVNFIITCGGFIQFNWPKSIFRRDIGDNKNPNSRMVKALVKEAEKSARYVLSEDLVKKLREFTDYITLGIDSYKEKISTTQNYINQLHIELVFLADLRNNKFHWTGKSYPTTRQQNGLVRISDLKTHFLERENVGKVIILGCHDLNLFNNRNWKKTGEWRKKIKIEFRKLAQREKPICVLHHPHTTVKIRTWFNAWNCLREILPSVKLCAGAGRYYEPDRKRSEWDALDNVLKITKCERTNTIDFIVRIDKRGIIKD